MSEEAIAHLRADPDLGSLVEEHGEVILDPADSLFERMIRSVVSQQVSTAAATSIRENLYDAVEITPQGVLAADEATLRDAGLSGQKVGYVRNIAEAFGENRYSVAYFEEMSNDEVVDELSSITGVGTWTGKMQLMFGLGRPDVFPVEDLGIRNGMQVLYGDDLTRAEMTELAEPWRPYRSYASLYLWRSVD
ncbi:MAG: DNA-3-methyladenine glycosylase [Halolamina sp.]